MGEAVEFENDRIRVLRIKHAAGERHSRASRVDRLIVYLSDGHLKRTENGREEVVRHKAGDVVWRNRSQHQIENLKNTQHEVLVVEFKK